MHIYIGTFLIAFTTLGLEIALTRLLSVATWYHLAFFAVSTAMLGMTAGAVTVHLLPARYSRDRLCASLGDASLGYALVTPVSLLLLCLLPLRMEMTVMSALAMLLATIVCSAPFYFSGVALAAVLTRHPLPVGRIYASDLIGAALGCLAVLGGVEMLDVPSLILLFAAIGVAAAWAFSWNERRYGPRRFAAWTLVLLLLVVPLNAWSPDGIAPVFVKGKLEDPSRHLYRKWNSFSRVVVEKGGLSRPQLWGASPKMPPQVPVMQYWMNVDGDAGTTLRRFRSRDDLQHLLYDVTNVAYYLRPRGGACVIGVGGGRDLHSALLFGHRSVVGIEVNPVFIDLLNGPFRDFAGLADRDGVRLVADEARSYLARSDESFSIMQMSLIDTWAATGAGAFSLTENALYTVDAWTMMLDRLRDDGILTVSRWFSPEDLGETGRMSSLAVAALLRSGATDPGRHLAMFTAGNIATLLVAKRPFSSDDVAMTREVSSHLGFALALSPDTPAGEPLLRSIVAARTAAALQAAVADAPLNYEPPTDDSPYFFNMLRLDRLSEAFRASPGVARGNLTATLTLMALLLCLAVVCLATIVLPLALQRRRAGATAGRGMFWPGALFFSLIGAGFMLLEIGLLQRLSVFLGHPTYALGVLLFTLIASTGCGSLLSERLPLGARRFVLALPCGMAAAILAAWQLLPGIMTRMVAASLPARAIASVALLLPLGLLLGLFFPCGMRLARRGADDATPWYWALNGIFGVLCSALAVLISIYAGISANFLLAALCYATLLLPVGRMLEPHGRLLPYPAARPFEGDRAENGIDRRLAG